MPASDHTLTPTQINTLARDLLEGAFPAVLVEGEIGNLARPSSGHVYFVLKDARASVRCALFRPKSQWLKFVPREGMQVLVRGRLTLYEPRGEYQLVLDTMEAAGEGALRRAYDALKARLTEEGLFDTARKRALPAFPRRIGVLTSPSGAVIRDILSVLGRRFPLVEVELLPVPVQGEGAATQIRTLLQRADASGRYDVLVLARGGGSLEDLWAFNDEALARAVTACATPTVSAIGHETDFSLTDFAADLRAPTPSAAAELLVPDAAALRTDLARLQQRLHSLRDAGLRERAQRADRSWLRLLALRPQARLVAWQQRIQHGRQLLEATLWQRLQLDNANLHSLALRLQAAHPRLRIGRLRERLGSMAGRPRTLVAQRLQHDALQLMGLVRSLDAISPLRTVARGYSILQREDGRIVRSTADVTTGDRLHARLGDGLLQLQVEGIHDAN